jgi:hypothetical protein
VISHSTRHLGLGRVYHILPDQGAPPLYLETSLPVAVDAIPTNNAMPIKHEHPLRAPTVYPVLLFPQRAGTGFNLHPRLDILADLVALEDTPP